MYDSYFLQQFSMLNVEYYKLGLVFNTLQKVYEKDLTEKDFEEIKSESIKLLNEQEEKLYVTDQMTITKLDNVVRIYLNLNENIDLVYIVTVLESVLKDKHFEKFVIFQIIIDNELVDVFAISSDLLGRFLSDAMEGATKLDNKHKQIKKDFKSDAAQIVALKLESLHVPESAGLSAMINNVINTMKKEHENTSFIADTIQKIKSVFNSGDEKIKKIKKYVLALNFLSTNKKYEANISTAITSYINLIEPDELSYKNKMDFARSQLKDKFKNPLIYIEYNDYNRGGGYRQNRGYNNRGYNNKSYNSRGGYNQNRSYNQGYNRDRNYDQDINYDELDNNQNDIENNKKDNDTIDIMQDDKSKQWDKEIKRDGYEKRVKDRRYTYEDYKKDKYKAENFEKKEKADDHLNKIIAIATVIFLLELFIIAFSDTVVTVAILPALSAIIMATGGYTLYKLLTKATKSGNRYEVRNEMQRREGDFKRYSRPQRMYLLAKT